VQAPVVKAVQKRSVAKPASQAASKGPSPARPVRDRLGGKGASNSPALKTAQGLTSKSKREAEAAPLKRKQPAQDGLVSKKRRMELEAEHAKEQRAKKVADRRSKVAEDAEKKARALALKAAQAKRKPTQATDAPTVAEPKAKVQKVADRLNARKKLAEKPSEDTRVQRSRSFKEALMAAGAAKKVVHQEKAQFAVKSFEEIMAEKKQKKGGATASPRAAAEESQPAEDVEEAWEEYQDEEAYVDEEAYAEETYTEEVQDQVENQGGEDQGGEEADAEGGADEEEEWAYEVAEDGAQADAPDEWDADLAALEEGL